ncbi:MAG: acetate--CoA ligase family protein [Candidatus Heimdallarchaeota archaeon]
MINYSKEALDAIFQPKSVAVIGASKKLTSWGFSIFHNILLGGFTEKRNLYAVNPNTQQILGRKTFSRVTDIPEEIDLGIIAVRASIVPLVMEDLADKGVRGVVVISSGFSEAGYKKEEHELVRIARKGNIRIVGPNGMGIFSAPANLNALMSWIVPIPGPISCISQSGNIGTILLRQGIVTGVGFRFYVSSGNEADLRVEDFLQYFAEDNGTKSIVVYLESVRNGEQFIKVAQNVSKVKPVIVLKGGKTPAGARAAQSHTGSLAGERSIYEAVFNQIGLTQAASIDELFELGVNVAFKPLPQGKNVGIISVGGGWAVLASDACQLEGLNVPPLHENLIKKINEILPPYWPKNNPIDTVALFDPSAFEKLLRLLLEQTYIDGVLLLGLGGYSFYPKYLTQSPYVSEEDIQRVTVFADMETHVGKAILKAEEFFQKPVFVVSILPFLSKATKVLAERGHLPFSNPESAARCFAKLVKYRKYLDKQKRFNQSVSYKSQETYR